MKEKMLPETKVSGAEDFLVVDATEPESVDVSLVFEVTLLVTVAPVAPLVVAVAFSKNTWGELSAVGKADLVLTLLPRRDTTLDGLTLDVTGESDEGFFVFGVAVEVVGSWVDVGAVVDVGADVEVVLGDVVALESDLLLVLEEPELKTTIFAVSPDGTVTTQKFAPPAPVA
jgi:hypothetical protein